ncbi:MAG: 50S ribosomal protein L25/general stress protein Ctc [Pseudomonadota bacterium]
MAETDIFTCEVRDRVGTGGARATRREGWVPGVLYGGDQGPVSIRLKFNEVLKAFNAGRMSSTLAKIRVTEGAETYDQDVVAREVQVDPVKDMPVHVDLMRINKGDSITVDVSVRFANEEKSPGIKRGGVLNIVRHTVELLCPATAIPEYIEADLAGLEINDVVHISAFKLPEGASPTITDRDFTVATISAPSGLKSSDNASDDAAEDEGAAEAASEDAE